ncbi:MAG TPA: DUF1688 family protein [Polyangiales bacterium]
MSVELTQALAELDSPHTVRARCRNVLATALVVGLPHFAIDLDKLPVVAKRVAQVTRRRFPDLNVPPHSRFGHFDAGGVARLAALRAELATRPQQEQARALVDVVVTSVLLDAGAGMAWRFREPETGVQLARSEGLAVASLHWLKAGGLSSRREPYHVDAVGLASVSHPALEAAFQVSDKNALVGVDGRVHLLRALGETLRCRPDVFGPGARLGALADFLAAQAQAGKLPAEQILRAVLNSLGRIWPGRIKLQERTLGDVWQHPAAGGEGLSKGFIPFHKLSQWLSYSLLYPLELYGLSVVELDALTGLAEYRNGGLFVDLGVLVPKHAGVLGQVHEVSSQVVVEWRALTVALLDELLPLVQAELALSSMSLPAMLEGGSWAAGRELAQEKRADGGSPLRVRSDGTVF